jgi:hypothetical protein
VLFGLLLFGAVGAIGLPASAPGGSSCGTWLTPEYGDEEVRALSEEIGTTYDGARAFDVLQDDASELAGVGAALVRSKVACDDALGTRRTLTIVFLGLAIAAPLGVVFVGGSRAT